MSNQEHAPEELICDEAPATGIEVLSPRDVPLGGPRALQVRRTLPQKQRSLIGAWCFLDHYGPEPVNGAGAMDVPPHPHTGLQTVSWLFEGEIEHADSVGSHILVRPGQVNLMTAGQGIQHLEVSTAATSVLHGVQLWVALPDTDRHTAPFFEHDTPAAVQVGDARLQVFVGSLLGSTSTVRAFTPLLGAEVVLDPGVVLDLDVDPAFEHGVLVDRGSLAVAGTDTPTGHLAYVPPGAGTLGLAAGAGGARVLVLGGPPFGEQIVMWWNFVGRTHEEVVAYREAWQAQVADRTDGRFGVTAGDLAWIPAPPLPNARLRTRG